MIRNKEFEGTKEEDEEYYRNAILALLKQIKSASSLKRIFNLTHLIYKNESSLK